MPGKLLNLHLICKVLRPPQNENEEKILKARALPAARGLANRSHIAAPAGISDLCAFAQSRLGGATAMAEEAAEAAYEPESAAAGGENQMEH